MPEEKTAHDFSGASAEASARPEAPVRRNQRVRLAVTGLGSGGEGVGKVDGFTVFVDGALPGDEIEATIAEVKRNYAVGALRRVIVAAPERVAARCPAFPACGGCQLQHLDYRAQLRWKRQQVVDALARIGHLGEVPVHPCLGPDEPWFYRNKAQFPVGPAPGAGGAGLAAGMYARGSHRIIDLDECLIQHPLNNAIIRAAKRLAAKYGIVPYDEVGHTGCLRHILARVGSTSGEAMAVFVTNGAAFPGGRALAAELMREVPAVISVHQNINARRTNVILGEETRLLAGRETITDRIGRFEFAISPRSFFQVNPEQTETLYRKAVEYAGLTGRETVIDAYCGIGTISLFLAERAGRVHGIEIVPEAIADARANAARNGVANVEFHLGETERVLPRLRARGVRADVIVVDPPRKGCEPAVLEAFAAMRPRRIVYVSCNPATLARDLARLAELGYQTVEAQPVDMFPMTAHVECVALLRDVLPFDWRQCQNGGERARDHQRQPQN